jgi:signal transduction histidine kinase
MTDDCLLAQNDGWLATPIDGDLIMMNSQSEVYLNLSGTGSRIWEMLKKPMHLGDLCLALSREFQIEPEEARRQVTAFVEQLVERKALHVIPSAGA